MKLSGTNGWATYGRAAVWALATLFAVGAAGHAYGETLPWMVRLTPGFLLLTAALATAPSLAEGGRAFAAWAGCAYAFTFAAEAAGVATGMVFGDYTYGPVLGPAWMGVPLIIAFNWVAVVNGATWFADRLLPGTGGGARWAGVALLAGLLATAFDWVMEPAAMRLDYWRWPGDEIPAQNYAAWFAIAALAAAAHPRRIRGKNRADCGGGKLAGAYVALQACFFAALRSVWQFGGG